MLWYICEEETCNCSWIPQYIEEWNAKPAEERLLIRKLKKEAKRIEDVMASGDPYSRLQEIYDELKLLGVND